MALFDGAALIVIDVQAGIDWPYHAAEGARNNPRAELVIAHLLASWRKAGRPIVHIRHDSTTPGSSYFPGQPGNAFKADIAPQPGEMVIAKRTNSAFIGTGLEAWFRERGISSLLFVGVSTNNSVEATVRMAGNLGFQAFLAEDGCFCFGKRDWNGVLRSAEEVHAMTLANLNGEYCTVVTSGDVLAA